MGEWLKFTAGQKEEIAERYARGESSWQIAKNFGVFPTKILRIVSRSGVPIRALKRYASDDSAFSSINTEEAAYWLGFIGADGYIRRRTQLVVNLCAEDSGHLEKLKSFLKTDAPVKSFCPPSNPYGFCQLAVSSGVITSDLQRHGIAAGKKSTHLRWPSLAEPLMKHFIRGYFDGDGCIYVQYQGMFHQNLGLTILSNHQFLESMVAWLAEKCRVETKTVQRRGVNFSEIRYAARGDVQTVLRYMYKDSSVFLNRKMVLAETLMDAQVVDHRKITRKDRVA